MSFFAFIGTLEIGLVYGLVALGVYLTFRVLDFPDLTVDGSFPMGAAVAATAIVAGINPWIATLMAIFAGGACGLVTVRYDRPCLAIPLLGSSTLRLSSVTNTASVCTSEDLHNQPSPRALPPAPHITSAAPRASVLSPAPPSLGRRPQDGRRRRWPPRRQT